MGIERGWAWGNASRIGFIRSLISRHLRETRTRSRSHGTDPQILGERSGLCEAQLTPSDEQNPLVLWSVRPTVFTFLGSCAMGRQASRFPELLLDPIGPDSSCRQRPCVSWLPMRQTSDFSQVQGHSVGHREIGCGHDLPGRSHGQRAVCSGKRPTDEKISGSDKLISRFMPRCPWHTIRANADREGSSDSKAPKSNGSWARVPWHSWPKPVRHALPS